RLAVAGSVTGTEIEEAADTAYLVLSDAPESFPLTLPAAIHEGRAVYLADAAPRPYVTSFEILSPAGIGWHREMLQPLDVDGPGLSDVLLYRPTGLAEPEALLEATALMLGTTALDGSGEVGLYWELYGASADEPIEYEIQIEDEEDGGFIDRLRRIFVGGSEEGGVTLGWTEPAGGPISPRAIILDLENVPEGEYSVILRAAWGNGQQFETRRRITVLR
ncbi:MAG: hypothetical protein RLN75_05545, partial [Longimicrobiales bacterium]